jgi:hypothetical protein
MPIDNRQRRLIDCVSSYIGYWGDDNNEEDVGRRSDKENENKDKNKTRTR